MYTYYTKEGKFETYVYSNIPFNKLNRKNGPAVEHNISGNKEWWVDGKRHRSDDPAIEYKNGSKEWYKFGKRHRLNGPAIEYKNGSRYWYINGKKLNKKEVETWIKNNNINLKTKEHQVLFMVMFG